MTWRVRLLAVPLMFASILRFASSAEAYSGNSWYRHPPITSAWHCGPTQNGRVLSAQACIIVTSSTYQSAVIVRNRLRSSTRAASVWGTQSVISRSDGSAHRWDFDCRTSALAANDYSVCFGWTTYSSPTGLDLLTYGRVTDAVSGEYLFPDDGRYLG